MPPLDDAQQFENHIPPAVRRQVERAEEIVRQLAEPQAAEEGEADPATVEPPAPEPTPAAPVDDWEQRYRTLQGKYDSEVPALRQRLQSLEQVLATMQQPLREPEPARAVATTVVISPEDEQTFGADLIGAARRWARAEMQSEFDTLKAELAQLKTGQQQVTAQTTQQRVLSALDADPELAAAGWRQINESREFIDWLGEIDPFAGVPRGQLLGDAYRAGDAVRTGRFFKTFLKEHTAVTSSPAPAPQPDPGPAPAAAAPTLEAMVAPGRPTGQAPGGGAPAEKRVWTNREIAAFYREVQQGRYAGREADKVRIESDIIQAASEGRVR